MFTRLFVCANFEWTLLCMCNYVMFYDISNINNNCVNHYHYDVEANNNFNYDAWNYNCSRINYDCSRNNYD